MINLIQKFNYALIFLLIITMIGGSYLVVCYIGGIEFAAYRFALAIAVIYLLFTRQLKCFANRFTKYVFFVFLFWMAYGAISLTWAPSLRSGIQELFYIGIGFVSYLVFYSLYHAEKEPRHTISRYWNISFLAVTVFLVVELITQKHLEGEYFHTLSTLGDFHHANFVPVFTFVNPNVLAIYLCISIVFAGYQLIQSRNSILNAAIALVAFDFLILTESRLGIMCVAGIVLIGLSLFLFRAVRKNVSFSIGRREVVAILALLTFNCFITGLEFRLLDSDYDLKISGGENKFSATIQDKHNAYLQRQGCVLLMGNKGIEKSTEHAPDKVFAIEHSAFLKLLDGRRIELVQKKINEEAGQSLFYGRNASLITILAIFSALILVCWLIVKHRDKTSLLVFGGSVLVLTMVFFLHVFDHTSPVYKRIVLMEPSTSTDNLTASSLYIISASSVTADQLESGNPTEAYLYSGKVGPNPEAGQLSSGSIRKNLVLNGLEYLRSSRFMGTGAGGYRENNLRKLNKYPDRGVGGAHNFAIEILSQYGIIVFLLLATVIIAVCYRLFLALRAKTWSKKHFLVLWLLITLCLMGNSNSSFLSLPLNWFLVIFMLIFAGELIAPLKVTDENKH